MAGVTLAVTKGTVKDSIMKAAISLQTPPNGERQASDIVCIIDISGSMGMEATIAGAGGAAESHGLSLLDVAKHGVRTMAHALEDKDRLGVVFFNHTAGVVFPLTNMDEAGKKTAEDRLDEMTPGGGTNIWEGLKIGLDCLAEVKDPGRFGHLMLLTDGESQGRTTIVPNLMAYKEQHESLPGSINTFGFGYNLDSRLLVDLATAGMGSYSFIPDAGFVGTAFVNMLSTLLVTMAQEVCLSIELEGGLELQPPGVHAGWVLEDKGEFKTVSLGSLQFGQSKDVVMTLRVASPGEIAVSASYRSSAGSVDKVDPVEVKVAGDECDAEADVKVEEQWCRSRFTEVIMQSLDRMALSQKFTVEDICLGDVQAVSEEIKASSAAESENVKALLEDVLGQSTEAVSRQDWFQKWGRHYLPSIMFAHRLQICNNFKDPGVQKYGGPLFSDLRDKADDIFCKIPAPKPTAKRTYGGGYGQSAPSAPVSMAAYHDSSAVCLDGMCLVDLPGGARRPLADLAKGDKVLGLGGAEAELLCLVRTPCAGGRARLVELPCGLRLTPHHPVLAGGEWRFPGDLAEAEELPCEAVFSFILGGSPALCVGGVACVGLGHGIQEGAAAHPYFATARVLKDLSGRAGFKDGLVELPAGGPAVLRDPETGLVCGLAPA